MQLVIKKIHLAIPAKISAVIYACLGAIGGIIFIVVSIVDGSLFDEGPGAFISVIGFLIVFPILYAIVGFLAGAGLTYLFNRSTALFGGVTIDVEKESDRTTNTKGGNHAKIMG